MFTSKFSNSILLLLAAFTLASCTSSKKAEELSYQGPTMGTSWSVKLVQKPDMNAIIESQNIQARLNDIEEAMSNWKEDSDVSKLNRMPAGCLLVSKYTEEVAEAAHLIGQQSDGYLDVTLSPLIELWGFGVQGEPPQEPAPEQLEAGLSRLGYKAISTTDRQLCKSRNELHVNYSSIAKGYAVDQVAQLLVDSGYKDFLVEVGGELYGSGAKLNGENWKVGIEKPSYGFAQELYATLNLDNKAVATSGDYRNFYEIDSVRYSHIIDPKVGRPVTHNAASVTVVHESAMVADGWATALLAAGPERGMQLAEEQQLMVLMILHKGEGYEQLVSTQWSAQ